MKGLVALLAVLLMLFLWAGPCMAEQEKADPSVGESVGKSARQVADDSTEAYNSTKDAIMKITHDVVRDAKKAFEDTKKASEQMVDDVKKGYQEEGESSGKDEKPSQSASEKK